MPFLDFTGHDLPVFAPPPPHLHHICGWLSVSSITSEKALLTLKSIEGSEEHCWPLEESMPGVEHMLYSQKGSNTMAGSSNETFSGTRERPWPEIWQNLFRINETGSCGPMA